jgi:signal transduction histidine kinase
MLLTRLAQYAAAGSMAAGKSSAKLGIIFDSAIRRLADRNRDANIDAQALYMCPIIAPYSCEIVLRELLDNALKFRQGRVQINIRVEQSPDKTVLGISDTGIGFDPQFCEKIMRPLERLHSADTYPGCGLGLAICQRTVHSWGGSLWAESQPGSGSTFWFDLPL